MVQIITKDKIIHNIYKNSILEAFKMINTYNILNIKEIETIKLIKII